MSETIVQDPLQMWINFMSSSSRAAWIRQVCPNHRDAIHRACWSKCCKCPTSEERNLPGSDDPTTSLCRFHTLQCIPLPCLASFIHFKCDGLMICEVENAGKRFCPRPGLETVHPLRSALDSVPLVSVGQREAVRSHTCIIKSLSAVHMHAGPMEVKS